MRFAMTLMLLALLGTDAYPEELKGIVLDSTGLPLAKASVQLCSSKPLSPKAIVYDTVTSDHDGRFSVEVPKSWFSSPSMWRQPLSLSVFAGEHAVGVASVSSSLPLPRRRIPVRVEEWTRKTVTVRDHDGEPVAECKVSLSTLRSRTEPDGTYPMGISLPVLHPSGAWPSSEITDSAGKVELWLPPRDNVGGIHLQLDGDTRVEWTQYSNMDTDEAWFSELQIPKRRSIPVHVEFDSPHRDIELQVNSMQQSAKSGQPMVSIQATCKTDEQGRGKVSVSPDSYVMLRNANSAAKGYLQHPNMTAMMTNSLQSIDVKYGPGTTLTAQILDNHQKPAANIDVLVFFGYGATNVRTDENGRIKTVVAPGQVMLVPAGDSGYRIKEISLASAILVPAGKREHDAGAVAVIKESKLIGVVSDSNGRRVAGATVYADWMASQSSAANGPSYQTQQKRYLTTNEKGEFELSGFDSGQQVRIAAWTADAASKSLQTLEVGKEAKPQELRIAKSHMTFAKGRVVDHSGRPMVGVPVQLRHRIETPLAESHLPIGDELDQTLTTDVNGEFKSQRTLPPWGEYVAVIYPASNREINSGWVKADAQGIGLPEIRESLAQAIQGRIVDSQGQPIGGARVSMLTSKAQSEAFTDSSGQFQLNPISGRAPTLIAEAEGFLANGVNLEGDAAKVSVELELVRMGAATLSRKAASETVIHSAQGLEERKKIAVALADKYLADKYKSLDQQVKDRISSSLARHLPDVMLDRIESLPSAETQGGQMIRMSLARGLAKTRPDRARELLDEIPEGPGRLFAFTAFEASAELSTEARMDLLAQMVQEIRAMDNPPYRVVSMGLVAERLLDIGQRETGEQLLREIFVDAKKLAPVAWSAYARGAFAEEIAQIDADAAMELIEPIKDNFEYNRHLKNAAHELAAKKPEITESWLSKFRTDEKGTVVSPRDDAVIRCCYRMIRVDAERARKLARSIQSSSMRIYGFTVMAESLLSKEGISANDRKLAKELHDEAWEIATTVRANEDQSKVAWLYPSTMAALLCRVTADIAPEQLPYRVWQTVALRRPMEQSGSYRMAGQDCVCNMALVLQDVDRDTAQRLNEWLPHPKLGRAYAGYCQAVRNAPQLLVSLSSNLSSDIDAVLASLPESQRGRVLLNLVDALVSNGEPRDRKIRGNMALWYPDDEDHVQD